MIFIFASLKTYDEFNNIKISNSAKLANTSNRTSNTPSDEDEDTGGGGSKKTCACNTGSDWCGDRDGPCTTTSNCESTAESGCGTLWAHPCNGWCKMLMPLI